MAGEKNEILVIYLSTIIYLSLNVIIRIGISRDFAGKADNLITKDLHISGAFPTSI